MADKATTEEAATGSAQVSSQSKRFQGILMPHQSRFQSCSAG